MVTIVLTFIELMHKVINRYDAQILNTKPIAFSPTLFVLLTPFLFIFFSVFPVFELYPMVLLALCSRRKFLEEKAVMITT